LRLQLAGVLFGLLHGTRTIEPALKHAGPDGLYQLAFLGLLGSI